MVKTISRELKSKHVVTLPDWGEFKLRISKERRIGDISKGGQATMLPAQVTVKFVADYKVRNYFHELGRDGTMVK